MIHAMMLNPIKLPSKACNTMYGNTAAWLLPKLLPKKIQPIINDLVRGRSSIVKGPILH